MSRRRRQSGSSLFRDAMLATAPLGYWRLNDPSGTAALAIVGPVGTYVGSPTLGVAGALVGDDDKAATFNGTTQYVDLGSTLVAANAMTLAAWLNTADTGLQVAMFSHSAWIGNDTIWKANTGGASLGGGAISPGWHLVAATNNGSTGSLYVDGVLAAGPTASIAPTFSPSWIGRHATDVTFDFNGGLDEPGIWARALTSAENRVLFQMGRGG